MKENALIDKKSLRVLTKHNPDWNELAKDCVCFANAQGGTIQIGIEDDSDMPPDGQRIPDDMLGRVSKQIQTRTINVSLMPSIETAKNGAEYIALRIPRSVSVASTSKGKYYLRVSDDCKPLLPDELGRLMVDRNAFVWETQVLEAVNRADVDPVKLKRFVDDIRGSDRVSRHVKEKSDNELLDYYLFASEGKLTNLGVLWVGKRAHRANLQFAPIVQFIKYDETETKVSKQVWDDFSLNPKEMIDAIYNDIQDWKEGIDFPDGIFRHRITNYDEVVVRELIANALVHRPYTMRGDIFIKLFPDRLEVHNPGLLPLGVTPSNILHQSVKRNIHLAKVFYDLKLMEAEGSGYDRIYEVLLATGKPLPIVQEGDDRVLVTVMKRITNKEVIRFIDVVNQQYQLRSRELISLGLIAQHTSLTAVEFANALTLSEPYAFRDWIGRLIELGLIDTRGRTKGMRYFVKPELLQSAEFKGVINLKKISHLRLRELIREVLSTYGESDLKTINMRIGTEITPRQIKKQLDTLSAEGIVKKTGKTKAMRYSI